MRKTSTSNSDKTKKVFSCPSHGCYVTVDDEEALSNYLVHLSSKNYVMVDIDLEEDMNERGDRGDFDDDVDDAH